MENALKLEFTEPLAAVDRGWLWLARAADGSPLLARRVALQYVDAAFRQVMAELQQRPLPASLPIFASGWLESDYYIAYRLPEAWELLDEYLKPLHWTQRLQITYQLCELVPLWQRGPLHPLGLNGHSLLVGASNGKATLQLIPCPPLQYDSPYDLIACEPAALACLAPETLRSVYSDTRLQDAYALGVLAGFALGCPLNLPPGAEPEALLELQARSLLFDPDLEASQVEPFLRRMEEFNQLIALVRQAILPLPSARPPRAPAVFKNACLAAIHATDPDNLHALARRCLQTGNPEEALTILEWEFRHVGDNVPGRQMAAEIAEGLGHFSAVLQHLDAALRISPGSVELRAQRAARRLAMYLASPPPRPGAADPEGDALLEDLAWLAASPLKPEQGKALLIQQSLVYQHRGDLHSVAQVLYLAVELLPADMEVLFYYGRALRELNDQPGLQQLVQTALHRIENLVLAEIWDRGRAVEWQRKFTGLLSDWH